MNQFSRTRSSSWSSRCSRNHSIRVRRLVEIVEVDLVERVVGPFALGPRAGVVLHVGEAAGVFGDHRRRGAGLADLAGAALPALGELGRRQPARPQRDGHVLELVVALMPPVLEPLGAAHDALVGQEQRTRVRIQHRVDALRDSPSVPGVEPRVVTLDVVGVGEPLEADGVVLGVAPVDFGQGDAPRDACRPGLGRGGDDTGDRVAPRGQERVARQVRVLRGEADALDHAITCSRSRCPTRRHGLAAAPRPRAPRPARGSRLPGRPGSAPCRRIPAPNSRGADRRSPTAVPRRTGDPEPWPRWR